MNTRLPTELCPQGQRRGLSTSSRPFNILKIRNPHYFVNVSKWTLENSHRMIICWLNPVLISFKNKVIVLADKFTSRYIWIQDINKVIMLWTENSFKGCLWILRGRLTKRLRPWKAELVNSLWFFSFCEWSSLFVCTFASKAVALLYTSGIGIGILASCQASSTPASLSQKRTYSSILDSPCDLFSASILATRQRI